jgi:hypothetical protein
MRKFIIKSLVYGTSIFLILNIIAFISLYFLNKSHFYKPQYVSNIIVNKKIDYVTIGSSNGLTTLNTHIIDSLISTNGFNLCIDDTALSSQYLMLKHFYQLNNKTDYCILNILGGLEDDVIELNDNDYRFITFTNKEYVSDYYYNLEKGYFKPLYFSKYLPLFGVSFYNSEVFYPSLVSIIQPNKRNRFDEKGDYSYPNNNRKNLLIKKDKIIQKITIKNPYFYKIQDLCKENNTKLIIYQSPIHNVTVDLLNNSNYFINHSKEIIPADMFFDEVHLNKIGSIFCSKKFADEFKQIIGIAK